MARPTFHDVRTALWHLRRGGLPQLSEWRRRRRVDRRNPPRRAPGDGLDAYAPVTADGRPPVFGGVRAGVILDDFSQLAFSCEWTTVPLTREGWRDQLDGLDLLFVESAWNGNGGQWQYQLTGTSGVKPEFRVLLAACRERGLPTVFWNKEDPPHFEDFLEAAGLFDHVFTSDVRLVEEYRSRLGHERVGVLSFAAQPAVHNPVRPVGPRREHGAAFAGMYFAHKYPERREQMDWLLGGAAKAAAKTGDRFEIFSRQHGGDERYQFPDGLAAHVVGSLPYARMLSAYKDFAVFLNVNSVVDSPSMCARRIFEITASGTPVVSAPSAATAEFFPPDEVFQPGDRAEARDTVRALLRSPELRDRAVHLAQRRIWREHTYTHRAMAVMEALGLEHPDPTAPSATVIASTNRPQQLEHLVRSVAAQTGQEVQLALVTHGFAPSAAELDRLREVLGPHGLVHREAAADLALGECLNLAVEAADGEVLAKFDDDDRYGAHYLADQIAALRYSGADLVGKQAHYLFLEGSNTMLLRFPEREHKYTDLVMGPTLTGHAQAFRANGFEARTTGEDTDFQRRLVRAGGTVYSADRFNFVQVRRPAGSHTWHVEDSELLATGTVHGFGFAPEQHFL
ncbi:glycosyltransferase family protein [Brevibacterium album]|uniref:glycosyltransferase family protein n=1 Tax=Brevibacterium album TaxID=417948 RepID=UPI0003F6CE4C|nr:glycosyltransferase [Brevibacterium album]